MKHLLVLFFFLFYFSAGCQLFAQNSPTPADSISIIQQTEHNLQAGLTDSQNIEAVSTWSLLFRGMIGLISIMLIAWLFSVNRKAVSIKIVIYGLLFQISLALAILYIPFMESAINFIGKLFELVLRSSDKGADFLFGSIMNKDSYGFIFAFHILPTIIFFSSLMSLLFYLRIVQRVVFVFAWLLKKALNMSGPESLAVAGNIFLGQTESPLLIKMYLPKLTGSEMFVVMTSGMATIAGGVMAAYIGMLGGDSPESRILFARHLVTASVMAAPGAVVIAKILFPQTEEIDRDINVPREQAGSNVLDAIGTGALEGLKLAANVAIMLLVFYSFIALFNIMLGWLGKIPVSNLASSDSYSLNEIIARASGGFYTSLSLEYLLGQIFSPLMWLIGVPSGDLSILGRLMGEKIIFTELVGYTNLKTLIDQGAIHSPRSIVMATYMLCGFANIASVGIQIGGIGALAPNKRVFLSTYGMRALLGGTLASLLSATIIGAIG
ncbi:MAG: Na+ dependent nucleoside transporter [Bacteroidota bacterium]|nr:MAG: Na+ dependent nucleoside transporter [Bacteroidota bacterium]